MLEFGGWEIFVVLALALIVVGPKDLPVLVRKVGQWVGKARSMARDFQAGMNEAAREVELDELKKSADISGALNDESRKINSDVRRAMDVNGSATPPRPSQTPQTPAAVRAAGLERKTPAQSSAATATAAPPPRPTPERRETEDDAVLADFQRGVQNGRDA